MVLFTLLTERTPARHAKVHLLIFVFHFTPPLPVLLVSLSARIQTSVHAIGEEDENWRSKNARLCKAEVIYTHAHSKGGRELSWLS